MENPVEKDPRIYTLDSLRGIAASFVVVHHVLRCTPGLNSADFWSSPAAKAFWVSFAFLGDVSVTLFFVLSGASLALSAMRAGYKISTTKFIIKRFFRIYPLYFGVIVVYFLFRPIYSSIILSASPPDWLSPQFLFPLNAKIWLTYLTMTFNFFDLPHVFNNALWSLPIEMQFYLFFPLIILFFRTQKKAYANLLSVIISVFAILFAALVSSRGDVFQRLWEFVGGILIAVNYSDISLKIFGPRRNFEKIVWALASIVFFVVNRIGISLTLPLVPSNYLDVLFSFSMVSFAFSTQNWKPQAFAGKTLSRIGEISYGIYLGHMIWLALFAPLLYRFNIMPWGFSILLFLLVYPLTVAMSNFVFEYYEKPFIKFGKMLSFNLEKRFIPLQRNVAQ